MVEVLIAAGILGGLGVVMFQITKDQASQSVRSKVVADVAQFKSQLQAMLLSPVHCNANFATRATGTAAATSFYKCNTTVRGPLVCKTAIGSGSTAIYPVFAAASTDWDATHTQITDRIRVRAINITINSVVAIGISNAQVVVQLDTRPDVSKNSAVPLIKTETLKIDVPVVMNAGTVIGCPMTWNTTVVY